MPLAYTIQNRYEREVYCPQCHMYSIRSDDAPKCHNCDSNLIRVVYDGNGKRLTGEWKNDSGSS